MSPEMDHRIEISGTVSLEGGEVRDGDAGVFRSALSQVLAGGIDQGGTVLGARGMRSGLSARAHRMTVIAAAVLTLERQR